MSTSLPPLDLTGAIVGTSVTLDFNQFVKFNPARMQQKAHLGLFNESGCGLQCVMKASGDSQYLPAGGWTTFEIESNDSNMVATVTYTLPNPPVSQLNAVYYAPGEEIPQSYTLGNSPIGIGGTVNTSSVQTLSNEGNAANMLVEDIGDVAFAQLFTIYTDGHALWSVDQSGIKHQVVKVQTAGNPLQLGQNGDTTEVLGDFNAEGDVDLNQFSGVKTVIHNALLHIINGATAGFLNEAASQLDNGALTTDGSGHITAIGAGTATNGSISGTLTSSFPIWGAGMKLCLITMGNFNGTAVTVTFPSSMARCFIWVGGLGGGASSVQPKLVGVAVQVSTITALGGAAAGTITANANAKQASMGEIESTIDSVVVTVGGVSNGTVILLGI